MAKWIDAGGGYIGVAAKVPGGIKQRQRESPAEASFAAPSRQIVLERIAASVGNVGIAFEVLRGREQVVNDLGTAAKSAVELPEQRVVFVGEHP